ncbi:hypothetical protein SPRG_08920 [Saprolegnia parasitica CBS 223.65]|uniref:Peptidase S1 domain-containing protein n=1 Tax=Saprolegnia parasitica (strain CBS 223.65) TaxID=695850 RepID=A0A067CGF0_SAPPC|nr:hypothetical protein SPRG_08920 [Saprolegnia parasitica CBS 223.65]KDO25621.1 hypothetical protein SPRG_08920 [Saprolegnia parasitica CBS 223.65]|eukprot:XP_012203654.1 hypothetical protein SPRG_08920 [Saprolegnia parasitica CBS 223.65]
MLAALRTLGLTALLATSVMGRRLIHGGDPAPNATFVAGVRYSIDGANRCAGTLIAPRLVLTAAHCLFTQVHARVYQFSPAQYVSIGAVDANGTGHGEQIAVVQSVVHPNYTYDALNWSTTHDFGVLILASASSYPPIALDLNPLVLDGALGRVYGWPDRAGNRSVERVTVLRHEACQSAFTQLSATNLCTQAKSQRHQCSRDSGGPLTIVANGSQVLVGVDSFGIDCQSGIAVSARLSSAKDFLTPFLTNATLNT